MTVTCCDAGRLPAMGGNGPGPTPANPPMMEPNRIRLASRVITGLPALVNPASIIPVGTPDAKLWIGPRGRIDATSATTLAQTAYSLERQGAAFVPPGRWDYYYDSATALDCVILDTYSTPAALTQLGITITGSGGTADVRNADADADFAAALRGIVGNVRLSGLVSGGDFARINASNFDTAADVAETTIGLHVNSRGALHDLIGGDWEFASGLDIYSPAFTANGHGAKLTTPYYGAKHAASRNIMRSVWSNPPDNSVTIQTGYVATTPTLYLRNNASAWGVLPSTLNISAIQSSTLDADDYIEVFIGLIDADAYSAGGTTITGVSPNLYQAQPTLTNLTFYENPTLAAATILAYDSFVIPNNAGPMSYAFEDEIIVDQTGSLGIWIYSATAREVYYQLAATRT